jgi:TrmH family RNA methyltransferase
MRHLESTRNPLVKRIALLEKPRERRKTGDMCIEGIRELNLAMLNGYEVECILFCESDIPEETLRNQLPETEAEFLTMNRDVAEKLLYRSGIPNALGIGKAKSHHLEQLNLPTNPLILVIEQVEKPGNLGAMLRTADAAGVDAVIVCDPATDVYNPNVIRSSLGCIFTAQIAIGTSEDTIRFLNEYKINSFAAHLEATQYHFNSNFISPTAIIMGSEAFGLSQIWEQNASEMIKIPMLGMHDSMNVSNAAAVLLFEAVRQRMQS